MTPRRHARVGWTTLGLVALAALGACAETSAPGSATALVGTWTYTGEQAVGIGSGQRLRLSGELHIDSQSGSTLSGDLAMVRTDATGRTDLLSGIVRGALVSTTIVDFDANFTDDTWRHVGSVSGDTLKGSWSSGDQTVYGSFVAVRRKQ